MVFMLVRWNENISIQIKKYVALFQLSLISITKWYKEIKNIKSAAHQSPQRAVIALRFIFPDAPCSHAPATPSSLTLGQLRCAHSLLTDTDTDGQRCQGSRQHSSRTGRARRESAPTLKRRSSSIRTMKRWSASVWDAVDYSRTTLMKPIHPRSASRNWDQIHLKCAVWNGWDPRWVFAYIALI